ncbi:MAG: PHP domain-containing protein [Clostridia bacterium]|nr:PHP domain-containing protein [Clostridia bacterium]
MTRYFYDLHIHSCLSPCGSDDATPANIAGIAVLNGLQIVALTDHNTTANCPAFFRAAKAYGIVPIAGMELTTNEDIHVVCLFPTLEDAERFDREVAKRRIRIRNKPEIFGNQLIMDEDDNVIGEEPDLLINATTLSLEDAYELVLAHGGACYPAHIDRQSNGMIAALGTFPDSPPYTAFELNSADSEEEYRTRFPQIASLDRVVSSDAHDLGSISEAEHSFMIDDEPYSSALVARRLIDYLRGEEGFVHG